MFLSAGLYWEWQLPILQPVLMCLYACLPSGDNNSNLDVCTLMSFISTSVQSCCTPSSWLYLKTKTFSTLLMRNWVFLFHKYTTNGKKCETNLVYYLIAMVFVWGRDRVNLYFAHSALTHIYCSFHGFLSFNSSLHIFLQSLVLIIWVFRMGWVTLYYQLDKLEFTLKYK